MRARLAPMLYDETDHEAAAAMRTSIVAKAERSDAAKRKQTTGRTDDGLPVCYQRCEFDLKPAV